MSTNAARTLAHIRNNNLLFLKELKELQVKTSNFETCIFFIIIIIIIKFLFLL